MNTKKTTKAKGNKKPKQPETVCWSCIKLDCSWAKNLTPVEGWTAEKTLIYDRPGNFIDSYLVIKCPDFIKENEGKKEFRKLCGSIDLIFYKNPKKRFTKILVGEKYHKIIKDVMPIGSFEEIFGVSVVKTDSVTNWGLSDE